eukprot:1676478-Rhodomonas_salina.2
MGWWAQYPDSSPWLVTMLISVVDATHLAPAFPASDSHSMIAHHVDTAPQIKYGVRRLRA